MSEAVPEAVPEVVSQAAAVAVPEVTLQAVSEAVPEVVSEVVLEAPEIPKPVTASIPQPEYAPYGVAAPMAVVVLRAVACAHWASKRVYTTDTRWPRMRRAARRSGVADHCLARGKRTLDHGDPGWIAGSLLRIPSRHMTNHHHH
jgi:hypothetical protein